MAEDCIAISQISTQAVFGPNDLVAITPSMETAGQPLSAVKMGSISTDILRHFYGSSKLMQLPIEMMQAVSDFAEDGCSASATNAYSNTVDASDRMTAALSGYPTSSGKPIKLDDAVYLQMADITDFSEFKNESDDAQTEVNAMLASIESICDSLSNGISNLSATVDSKRVDLTDANNSINDISGSLLNGYHNDDVLLQLFGEEYEEITSQGANYNSISVTNLLLQHLQNDFVLQEADRETSVLIDSVSAMTKDCKEAGSGALTCNIHTYMNLTAANILLANPVFSTASCRYSFNVANSSYEDQLSMVDEIIGVNTDIALSIDSYVEQHLAYDYVNSAYNAVANLTKLKTNFDTDNDRKNALDNINKLQESLNKQKSTEYTVNGIASYITTALRNLDNLRDIYLYAANAASACNDAISTSKDQRTEYSSIINRYGDPAEAASACYTITCKKTDTLLSSTLNSLLSKNDLKSFNKQYSGYIDAYEDNYYELNNCVSSITAFNDVCRNTVYRINWLADKLVSGVDTSQLDEVQYNPPDPPSETSSDESGSEESAEDQSTPVLLAAIQQPTYNTNSSSKCFDISSNLLGMFNQLRSDLSSLKTAKTGRMSLAENCISRLSVLQPMINSAYSLDDAWCAEQLSGIANILSANSSLLNPIHLSTNFKTVKDIYTNGVFKNSKNLLQTNANSIQKKINSFVAQLNAVYGQLENDSISKEYGIYERYSEKALQLWPEEVGVLINRLIYKVEDEVVYDTDTAGNSNEAPPVAAYFNGSRIRFNINDIKLKNRNEAKVELSCIFTKKNANPAPKTEDEE